MGGSRPKSICSAVGSMLLFFFHLDCNFIPHAATSAPLPSRRRRRRRKKKISPLISLPRSPACVPAENREDTASPSSFRSFVRHLVCCFFLQETSPQQLQPRPPCVCPREVSDVSKATASSMIADKPDELPRVISAKSASFASRDKVIPCASCEEVFAESHLLDQHKLARHALTDLADGDSGLNIVRIIFQSGWKGRGRGSARLSDGGGKVPVVQRVLKIQSSPKMLASFEECRDSIRSRAAARWAAGCGESGYERCMADGNERLRFYCATFLCGLTHEGRLAVCGSPFCSACGIVRRGFTDKDADGVVTHGTGWGAHSSLPEELEREFAAMKVRRAMLLCRVVAGRVAVGEGDAADGRQASYDSASVGGVDDLLLVFDPRAVLPCFLILYSV